MSPVDILLSRLEKFRGSSPKWMACCPAHDDKSPSLSIRAMDDGRVLIHCHAGCSPSDVMIAVGLSLSDLFPDGSHGELSGKKHREPENRLYKPGYLRMQDELNRLRARLSSK